MCFDWCLPLQATDLLQGLIPSKEDKDLTSVTRDHYERLYVFTIMWSVGAFLELDDRIKLEEYLRKHDAIRLDLPQIQEGSDDTMFDFVVDDKGIMVTQSF